MNEEQLILLLNWVELKIAEHVAKNSSDGGIWEYIAAHKIEQELRRLVRGENDD